MAPVVEPKSTKPTAKAAKAAKKTEKKQDKTKKTKKPSKKSGKTGCKVVLKKGQILKFQINCDIPVADKVLDAAALVRTALL